MKKMKVQLIAQSIFLILFKIKVNTNLKMVLFTKVNGSIDKDMVMEFKFGQMAPDMKENGKIIKLMVVGYFIMLMEIFSMANGKMTKRMVLELITIQTVVNMKENGLMICKMGTEKKLGKINQPIKVNTKKVKNMDLVFMCGLMEVYIMETGLIIKFKVKVTINGQMEDNMKENGLRIKCMVRVN